MTGARVHADRVLALGELGRDRRSIVSVPSLVIVPAPVLQSPVRRRSHCAAPGGFAAGYPDTVMTARLCSRVSCGAEAIATLTYVYSDSMAVLGPLSENAEPHSYDLCAVHAGRLSAPKGWTILRHTTFDTAS